MVKSFVDIQKGEFDLKSAVGKGTNVTATLQNGLFKSESETLKMSAWGQIEKFWATQIQVRLTTRNGHSRQEGQLSTQKRKKMNGPDLVSFVP